MPSIPGREATAFDLRVTRAAFPCGDRAMSRPWMPFYWGDYFADTRHLTTIQHGAYLLLIGHYWQHGGLPTDDATLKRIVGVSGQGSENQWRSICKAIAPFFEQPGWRHRRIDEELQKSEIIRTKRQISGRIGGLRAHNKSGFPRIITEAIAKQTGYHPQPHLNQSNLTSSELAAARAREGSTAKAEGNSPQGEKELSATKDSFVTTKRPTDATRADLDAIIAQRRSNALPAAPQDQQPSDHAPEVDEPKASEVQR